jgi:chromosomal replication initiation ATPase DnaA
MGKQLPLPFPDLPHYAAEDFVTAASNELAQEFLAKPTSWTNGRLVLWGEPGCGKSHLACVWAGDHGVRPIHGPTLRGLPDRQPGPVAIDDADMVPDEAALLHLINSAAEAGQPVLLTAQTPPSRTAYTLPDLASRLRASLAVQILPPDDNLLATLLGRLAADRQLTLDLPVRNFLLTRLPRTPGALREAVARLDKGSLGHRKITRTLATDLLADLVQMS